MSQSEISDNIESLCRTVELTTNIQCKSCSGTPQSLDDYSAHRCNLCSALQEYTQSAQSCRREIGYAAFYADKTGAPYLYACRLGMYHFAVPLVSNEEKGTEFLFVGPMLMHEERQHILENLVKRFALSPTQKTELYEIIDGFATVSSEKLRALMELFTYLSGILFHKNETAEFFAEPYMGASERPPLTSEHTLADREDALFSNILKGDERLANETLGSLIESFKLLSGADILAIKARAIELVVILSRMATRVGINCTGIFGSSGSYMKEIAAFTTEKEITSWLDKACKRFSVQVIGGASKNASDLLPAIRYIRENLAGKITLEIAAGQVFLTPAYFSRIFKEHMGISFSNYLNRLRVEKAKRHIQDGALSLSEIASMSGFGSQSYFSKVFRVYAGMTPKEYKNQHQSYA